MSARTSETKDIFMKREDVYKQIDGEREYQDSLWPQNAPHSTTVSPLSIGEFVLMLEEYCARARAEWTGEKKPEHKTMAVVRKIAGIAVNAMEQHGAPPR